MSNKSKNTKIASFLLVLTLILGLFSPSYANAGFFDLIFGNFVSADTKETISQGGTTENVQNLSILEANSTLETKKEETNTEVDSYISENALVPSAGLLREEDEEYTLSPTDQISVYVVRNGDTLSKIAEMFDVSVNTIIWANDLKGKKVSPGETLIILPVSGVKHIVKKGDSLKSIAKDYKVEIDDIIEYNNLEKGAKLALGEELIIPGGEVVEKVNPKPKNTPSGSSSNIASLKAGASQADTTGYFGHPLPGSRRVRGLSRTHKGVDFAAPTGTPIYAAASGKVIFAKYGWNGRYGNMVILSHPNGTRTLYAHMSKIGTTQGEEVNKGEVIGYVGSTGRSTGPHLHLEVLGGKNPF